MKRLLSLLFCLLIPFSALADGYAQPQLTYGYLIPDSNTRILTREELWDWDYEALGYILNEIFARHGYVFIPGGIYDDWFSAKSWYRPNSNPDNVKACYPKLNSIEWSNERLIKQVRTEMRTQGTTNPSGRSIWDEYGMPDEDDDWYDSYWNDDTPNAPYGKPVYLNGFIDAGIRKEQLIAVYSAPSYSSWRGADGKASVGTSGGCTSIGWEGEWLMIMYETSGGRTRVGYINANDFTGDTSELRLLHFAKTRAHVKKACSLTDDPAVTLEQILRLQSGDTVTYLGSFFNDRSWHYVETRINGKRVRGFVPWDSLEISGRLVYPD